jgi:hypothetical protein
MMQTMNPMKAIPVPDRSDIRVGFTMEELAAAALPAAIAVSLR